MELMARVLPPAAAHSARPTLGGTPRCGRPTSGVTRASRSSMV